MNLKKARLGGPRGAGSRGRGGEEGRTRTKHQPQLCPVPGSAGWGGREAELTPKPGEVGTGKLMPPEMEGEQEISQRK